MASVRSDWFGAGTLLSAMGLTSAGFAQPVETTLPELTVSSPSPIASSAARSLNLQTGVLPVATTTFSPVTIVTADQIARDQPRTLGDALGDRPGISASTYAPGAASRPIIRGLDNSRVRIQENGIGIQDVSELGEDHAVPINPLVS